MRQRDFVASILVVLLGRTIHKYNNRSESLVVSLTPSFYSDFEATETQTIGDSKPYVIHTAKPVPFDIDGDGIVEALIIPYLSTSSNGESTIRSHQWGLKVLDLKPLHSPRTKSNNFHPTTLFSSIHDADGNESSQKRVPIRITSDQIFFRENSESPESSRFVDEEAIANDVTKTNHQRLAKTPRGGLPSFFTVWSDGLITMHSVTADLPLENNDTSKSGWVQSQLELREMWQVNPFIVTKGENSGGANSGEQLIDFEELDVLFRSDISIGEHGAIIVATKFQFAGIGHMDTVTSYYAIDAFNGTLIWAQKDKTVEETEKIEVDEIEEGSSNDTVETVDNKTASKECLNYHRHWIMHPSTGALPHVLWNSKIEQGPFIEDSKLVITHFDEYYHYKPDWVADASTSTKSKTIPPYHPEPNVALFHNRKGVDVISLKDGASVCKMSLLSRGLYADLNNDGIIDHLQIVTDDWKPYNYGKSTRNSILYDEVSHASDKFAAQIIEKIKGSQLKDGENSYYNGGNLCHALLLSGMPAREELFNTPLCNNKSSVGRLAPTIHSASPLLVEAYDVNTRRVRQDIVFALSDGTVRRYDLHGKQKWSLASGEKQIPLWEHDENTAAFLGRIDFKQSMFTHSLLASMKRPILIAGSDNMSILSSGQGKILAHETFHRLSVSRPILHDMNGDGTKDILIISAKSVQCYCVTIQQGRSILIKIMLLFLTIVIGVALYFHSDSKRRSTDELKA